MTGLDDDSFVTGWWQRLGLPGLFDLHVHFLPPPVMAKVREQFDTAGPLIGRAWPLRYRGDDEERIEQLRRWGVRRFSALPYAHRPGISSYLNEWAGALADRVPECLRCATFYPEPGVTDAVRALVDARTEVFKVHVQVGDFSLLDPLLDDAWALIADAGTPVVVHASGGPVGNAHTGPAPFRELVRRHPALRAVVAHMGAPEYLEFLEIAEEHESLCLDTTMAFTDFFEEMAPFPRDVLPRVAELGRAGRVLLGTDFPNIPYAYGHQLEALDRLGLGEDWLRAVCWHNGDDLLRSVAK